MPSSPLAKIVSIKDGALFLFVFTSFLVLNHAGALALAGVTALGGLAGILGHRIPNPKTWPAAIWAGLAFLLWAYSSSLWSPYATEGLWTNAFRFAVGIPLYGLLILALSQHSQKLKSAWRWMLTCGFMLSALVFAIDFLTQYSVTRLGDPNAIDGDIEQNLAHGISILTISLPPLVILIARHFGRGPVLAVIAIALCGLAIAVSGNDASLIAGLAALCVMMAAKWKPKFTLGAVFVCLAMTIIAAPVLAFLAAEASPGLKASLPFSWEWRVETWGYLSERILDHPFIGNGFDSLRTFTDTITMRGFEDLSIVNMHAHNIGLHIWAELGLIGASLAILPIILTARALLRAEWLTHDRAIAISGITIAVTIIANLSYSAWQDWWLGGIFTAYAFVTLLPSGKKTTEPV